VLVDVGGGPEAQHAHLASLDVEVGDEATSGEPLGVAGCRGWCTGAHLHFELRDDGAVFDRYRCCRTPSRKGPPVTGSYAARAWQR